jgi:uncharacterized protein (TIGR00369 family)
LDPDLLAIIWVFMRQLPHTQTCFVCGESNPAGLRLRSETDGRVVRAHCVFDTRHVGFKQTVHGGLTATLLDELMTWACAVGAKRFAYCAELNVRYVQPVRPGQPTVATAELVTNRRGRILEAKAELADQTGTVLASATGKYIPLKPVDAAGMATDFIGDLRWVFEPSEDAGA